MAKAVPACSRMSGRTQSSRAFCESFVVKSAGLKYFFIGEMPARGFKITPHSPAPSALNANPKTPTFLPSIIPAPTAENRAGRRLGIWIGLVLCLNCQVFDQAPVSRPNYF
jgi:hypothetical protein